MQKVQTVQPGGFWLMTGAAMIWGTIGVATQAIYTVDTTSSLFINLARMLVATPVLLLACWHKVGQHMFRIRRRDLAIMALNGMFLAASQAAYFAAIRETGVAIATLLTICIAPLVVTGLSVLLRLESPSRRIVLALICALLGSVLLVGLHRPEGSHYNVFVGTIFALLSAATYACMIICGRLLADGYHALQVTAVTFGVGTIVLAALNLTTGMLVVHTAQGWLLVVYLGLVPTALAYWLFQTGLRSVTATAASIVSLLEPMVATLLAWMLFGETLAATGIAGAGLMILSIFLLSREQT